MTQARVDNHPIAEIIETLDGESDRYKQAVDNASACDSQDNNEEEASAVSLQNKARTKRSDRWENMFDRLLAFRKEFGHCRVPIRYPEDPALGNWVKAQRQYHKQWKLGNSWTSMNAEKEKRLNEIGFKWVTPITLQRKLWECRYAELKKFVEENGHALVNSECNNPELVRWVYTQRRQYSRIKRGHPSFLTDERIKRLNDLGFCWARKKLGKTKASVHPSKQQGPLANSHASLKALTKRYPLKKRVVPIPVEPHNDGMVGVKHAITRNEETGHKTAEKQSAKPDLTKKSARDQASTGGDSCIIGEEGSEGSEGSKETLPGLRNSDKTQSLETICHSIMKKLAAAGCFQPDPDAPVPFDFAKGKSDEVTENHGQRLPKRALAPRSPNGVEEPYDYHESPCSKKQRTMAGAMPTRVLSGIVPEDAIEISDGETESNRFTKQQRSKTLAIRRIGKTMHTEHRPANGASCGVARTHRSERRQDVLVSAHGMPRSATSTLFGKRGTALERPRVNAKDMAAAAYLNCHRAPSKKNDIAPLLHRFYPSSRMGNMRQDKLVAAARSAYLFPVERRGSNRFVAWGAGSRLASDDVGSNGRRCSVLFKPIGSDGKKAAAPAPVPVRSYHQSRQAVDNIGSDGRRGSVLIKHIGNDGKKAAASALVPVRNVGAVPPARAHYSIEGEPVVMLREEICRKKTTPEIGLFRTQATTAAAQTVPDADLFSDSTEDSSGDAIAAFSSGQNIFELD